MAQIFDGTGGPVSGQFAIVVSRYNEHITSKLLSGAVLTLREADIPESAIDVAWVPGAWEIPLVAQRLANSGSYAAVLCLGAVIKGNVGNKGQECASAALEMVRLLQRLP
jgi:6,7-dimethyl-8-ribityllumazine synthase